MDCDDGTTSNYTSDDRLLDLDIYSDLITTENDQPNNEITKQYEDLLKVCEELKQSNANLEKQNKTLLENISKLYKTAKFELYQKNLKLKGMKEHLDAVIFRRTSKHGNYSAAAANNKSKKHFTFNANKSSNDEKCEIKSVNNFNRARQRIIKSQEDKSPNVLSSASKMLLHYSQDQDNAKRKKLHKRTKEVSANKSKTGGNRCVESCVDTKRPQLSKFNHNKSEVVKKAEAIKRKIRKSSVSPRKNYDNKYFSPNHKMARKRNEMEDGEILSDSEETLKIKEWSDSSRKVRKFDIDVDEKIGAGERRDYGHQLEMNRIKMKIRREKVLLSKAREQMNSNEKKYR